MSEIFTKPWVLEEVTNDVTLSDKQVHELERLDRKLDSWQKVKRSRIVAYVGRFGSGKTTTLNGVKSRFEERRNKHPLVRFFIKNNGAIWLNFEAWRYSNREQLWEGFTIEVIDKIKGRTSHTKTTQSIDGINGAYGTVFRHPKSSSVIILIVWAMAASILWWCLYDNTDAISRFIIAVLKYALPVLFVVIAFLGISSVFSKKEPLKRVFELENKLEKTVRKMKQPIVIVVEDIDRNTTDEGVVFLETLRSFIDRPRKKRFKYPLIVIAPQSHAYMSILSDDEARGIERGLKIYNNIVYYADPSIRLDTILKLLSDAGVDSRQKERLALMIKQIMKRYHSQLSIRLVKSILREVNEFAEVQDRVDSGVAFLLIASRYIRTVKVNSGGNEPARLLDIISQNKLTGEKGVAGSFASLGEKELFNILSTYLGISSDLNEIQIDYKSTNQEVKHEVLPAKPSQYNQHILITFHERYKALLD